MVKEMNDILVSILVPVYKVPEQLLRKCIESLISQTLKEIEIILVDDGSPDACGRIIDEYAKNDDRIVVVHQKNKGLSGARNTAYEKATGKYVMFLDGDDFLENTACQISFEVAENENVQIVFWDIVDEYFNSQTINKTMPEDFCFFDKSGCKDLQARVLDFNGRIAQVFAKLIRKDLLVEHDIKHVENLKQGAEGIVFNIKLFEHATSACYISKPLNHYVYNNDSISHSHNEENYYMIVCCFEYIKEYIQNSANKEKIEKNLYTRLLYVIVTTGITGYFNPTNKQSYKQKVQGYKKFLSMPLIKEALAKGDYKSLSLQRRIVLMLVNRKIWGGGDATPWNIAKKTTGKKISCMHYSSINGIIV